MRGVNSTSAKILLVLQLVVNPKLIPLIASGMCFPLLFSFLFRCILRIQVVWIWRDLVWFHSSFYEQSFGFSPCMWHFGSSLCFLLIQTTGKMVLPNQILPFNILPNVGDIQLIYYPTRLFKSEVTRPHLKGCCLQESNPRHNTMSLLSRLPPLQDPLAMIHK